MSARFPLTVHLTPVDLALLANRERLDEHRGGFADLMRDLRLRWIAAGCGSTLDVIDWPMWERIMRYAREYGSGGWQDCFRRLAAQLPRDVPNPQGGLFD